MAQLIERKGELETFLHLWTKASVIKDHRIQELEAECIRLRQRVARLSRMVDRHHRPAIAHRVPC